MHPKRVLLKLSGEAFAGTSGSGVDQARLLFVAEQIYAAAQKDVQIAIVVGGGNFLRGATLTDGVISRTTADHMGMMATILNALALSDALNTFIFQAIQIIVL